LLATAGFFVDFFAAARGLPAAGGFFSLTRAFEVWRGLAVEREV
jgi:hypothetical protein